MSHQELRKIVGTAYARWSSFRYRGRIRGASFIIRKPALLRVEGTGQITFGSNVMVEQGARLVARANLYIGDDVYVGKNATIIAFADLSIGNRTLIGENVSIHTEDHGPIGDRDNFTVGSVSIGEDCWVGAGTVITRGATLGDGVTIGANSVVRGVLPPRVLAAGAPAEVKKKL